MRRLSTLSAQALVVLLSHELLSFLRRLPALRSGSGGIDLPRGVGTFDPYSASFKQCVGSLHSAQTPGVLTSREASPHSPLIPFHLNSAKTFDTLRSSSGGIAFSRTAKLLRRLPALRSGSGGIDLPRGVATFDPYSVSLKQCEDFRHSPLKLWWYCFFTNCQAFAAASCTPLRLRGY